MVSKVQLCALLVVAIGCYVMAPVSAFDHIVGGHLGWSYPPNVTYYEEWASKPRVFGVGDKLVFPFRSGHYNIIQVGGNDFENCTMNQVIQMIAMGPATVTLDRVGDYYFFDGVGLHCEHGQKLKVTAVEAEGTSGKGFSFDLIDPEKVAPAPVSNTNVSRVKEGTYSAGAASSGSSGSNGGVVFGSVLVFLVSMFV